MPHDLVGVEIEASEVRTARELWEKARPVVPNSSFPDPVPHSRYDVEARVSANVQTAGEDQRGTGESTTSCSKFKLS